MSVAAVGGGQGKYYVSLAGGSYYTEGGEPLGCWLGRGREALGLDGTVGSAELLRVLEGLDPSGEKSLVQLQHYADGRSRQPGWDLTFSAPKDLSVLWSQLPDHELRAAIQEAHFAAVKATLEYVEKNAAWSRRGRGGSRLERVGLVAAAFEHGTSRAQDPHLHTHVVVANVGVRPDGTFGTVASQDFFWHKMVGGAFYRNELATRLQALGLEVARDEWRLTLPGVPRPLVELFSKRRAEIVAAMEQAGVSGAPAAALFTLSTRQVKEHVARELLFAAWRTVGQRAGFEPLSLLRAARLSRPDRRELPGIVDRALRELVQRESHFLERDLLRLVLESSLDRGFGSTELQDAVRMALFDPSRVVRLGRFGSYERYTTPEMYELEEELLRLAERSLARTGHEVSERVLARTLRGYPFLEGEQRDALHFITVEEGSVKCVIGMAGTGKTTLLATAREVWEEAGFQVIGVALAAHAAQNLQSETGIESRTIESLLWRIERAEKGRRPRPFQANTVLVVDEAGMVDTRRMQRVLAAAEQAGAKVVLVGDPDQIQPIEAGGPFRAVANVTGAAHLEVIRRQDKEWMREAVRQFADGSADTALSLYAEAGCLDVAPTKSVAIAVLVDAWTRERTASLEDTLILAGTNADVLELNSRVQARRLELGELLDGCACEVGQERVFPGDRVVFTKTDRGAGIFNGDFGTVLRIAQVGGRAFLTVALDRTRHGAEHAEKIVVVVEATSDLAMKLGYAATTHKAQGATVQRAFVLAGGWMQDRHLSYVQMSRAREMTKIFATEATAGEDLTELARAMSRDRTKELAHEVEERGRGEPRGRGENRERSARREPALSR